MPSPKFTFRMPKEDREALEQMSKLYGAPSAGGFVAEMVSVMCSGDASRVQAFNAKLIRAAGEQLILKLGGAVDTPALGNAAPKLRKRRKKRRKRDRTT